MQQIMQVPDSVRRGIDETNRKFENAFNAGDPARAAREVYTRDARVLPPGGPTVRGREQLEQFWQVAAQQMGIQRVQLATVELEAQGDTAYEIGRATLTVGEGQQVEAKFVVVWKKEDGQWKWDIDIWNGSE